MLGEPLFIFLRNIYTSRWKHIYLSRETYIPFC